MSTKLGAKTLHKRIKKLAFVRISRILSLSKITTVVDGLKNRMVQPPAHYNPNGCAQFCNFPTSPQQSVAAAVVGPKQIRQRRNIKRMLLSSATLPNTKEHRKILFVGSINNVIQRMRITRLMVVHISMTLSPVTSADILKQKTAIGSGQHSSARKSL